MDKNSQDLIAAIRNVVCHDSVDMLTCSDWHAVWSLATRHHLEAIIYEAAKAVGRDIPSDVLKSMRTSYYAAIAHDIRQQKSLEKMLGLLSEAGVSYALMKGALLKSNYPASYMRFMCDIDVLISTSDRGTFRKCMEKLGSCPSGESAGDEIYVIDGMTGVEPHGLFLYRLENSQIINYSDWSLVDEAANRLTEEGFALNLIGHAVGDMRKGGPGLRYVLDLWVYRHRSQAQPNWEFVYDRMRSDGIYAAGNNLLNLSEYLFGNGKATPLMDELADYVLSTSLYGEARRAGATEVALSGGKGAAIYHQLFRDREDFENRYPWLRQRAWLLPVAWAMRVGHSLRVHGKLIPKWLRGLCSVSRDEEIKQRERLTRFGL